MKKKRWKIGIPALMLMLAMAWVIRDRKIASWRIPGAIEQVCTLEMPSCNLYLKEASLILGARCVKQRWEPVNQAIRSLSLPVIDEWNNGDATHCHYLVQKDAFQFPSGHRMDLHLQLSSFIEKKFLVFPEHPGRTYDADVVLVSELNAPYEEILAQNPYPEGSVFDAVLRAPRVRVQGLAWPYVKSISIQYDVWEFYVAVEFIASLDDPELAMSREYYTVGSGLEEDPPVDRLEKDVWSRGANGNYSGDGEALYDSIQERVEELKKP